MNIHKRGSIRQVPGQLSFCATVDCRIWTMTVNKTQIKVVREPMENDHVRAVN